MEANADTTIDECTTPRKVRKSRWGPVVKEPSDVDEKGHTDTLSEDISSDGQSMKEKQSDDSPTAVKCESILPNGTADRSEKEMADPNEEDSNKRENSRSENEMPETDQEKRDEPVNSEKKTEDAYEKVVSEYFDTSSQNSPCAKDDLAIGEEESGVATPESSFLRADVSSDSDFHGFDTSGDLSHDHSSGLVDNLIKSGDCDVTSASDTETELDSGQNMTDGEPKSVTKAKSTDGNESESTVQEDDNIEEKENRINSNDIGLVKEIPLKDKTNETRRVEKLEPLNKADENLPLDMEADDDEGGQEEQNEDKEDEIITGDIDDATPPKIRVRNFKQEKEEKEEQQVNPSIKGDVEPDSEDAATGLKASEPNSEEAATGDKVSKSSEPAEMETDEPQLISSPLTSSPSTGDSSATPKSSQKKSFASKRGRQSYSSSRKPLVDVTNPAFLKPFEFGWKRELVYRVTQEDSAKRMADVYYYSPRGKKLRSSREVLENLTLTSGLTIDNFTFFKESLGVDDVSKEIIRHAKPTMASKHTKPQEAIKSPSIATPDSSPLPSKRTPKPKVHADGVTMKHNKASAKAVTVSPPAKTASPPGKAGGTAKGVSTTKGAGSAKGVSITKGGGASPAMPRILIRPKIELMASPKAVVPPLPSLPSPPLTKAVSNAGPVSQLHRTAIARDAAKKRQSVYNKNASPAANKAPNNVWKPREVIKPVVKTVSLDDSADANTRSTPAAHRERCSIQCLKAMGLIPTLHCSICLCLYHPECCGIAGNATVKNYVCKNCQNDKAAKAATGGTKSRTILTPPPLTPISSLSGPRPVRPSLSPPKLQRLLDGKLVTQTKQSPQQPSIVGGVTTWLPPSSTIQLAKPAAMRLPPPPSMPIDNMNSLPAQTMVNMNGRRYVVVPKHNILSVSSQEPSQQTPTSGCAILPKPSQPQTSVSQPQYIVTTPSTPIQTTYQSPPGVLLVPYMPSGSQPQALGKDTQYVLVNGPTGLQAGNFVIGNMASQPQPAIPTSQPALPPQVTELAVGTKRKLSDIAGTELPTKRSKAEDSTDNYNTFMSNFATNLGFGYSALLLTFSYLKVHELLRAARVSRMWNDIASHRALWKTVSLKNCPLVRDWEGFRRTLSRNGTRRLDLRKMLLPDRAEGVRLMWVGLLRHLPQLPQLMQLHVCKCSGQVVGQIARDCRNLRSLNASLITSDSINLSTIGEAINLTELRLKSIDGMQLINLKALHSLRNLKTLAITSASNLQEGLAEVLGGTRELECLELGDCLSLSEKAVGEGLRSLTKLRRLRLEKGQTTDCPTVAILMSVSKLPQLREVELINFDIKTGFDAALATCTNITQLLLIPTYITQSATTNKLVVDGVEQLSKTLKTFVWVLTLELLRVTDLFIDQWDSQKGAADKAKEKKLPLCGDSIPILKPFGRVPVREGSGPSQVDIVPVNNLQKELVKAMPSTSIKIERVAFNATWRQTLADS